MTFLRMEDPTALLCHDASTTDQGINAQAPLILRSRPNTAAPWGQHCALVSYSCSGLALFFFFFILSDNKVLLLDLLAIHMVRERNNSTIISFHLPKEDCTTSAKDLHARVRFAGESVYWQNIFKKSDDPTFVFLVILWHALYTWDEALEGLYIHFCWLVSPKTPLHIINRHVRSKFFFVLFTGVASDYYERHGAHADTARHSRTSAPLRLPPGRL
jgi:hypothetical protein